MSIQRITDITEAEYRKLKADSFSSLKSFSNSPLIYYKEYILGGKVTKNAEESEDLRMGLLVDVKLLGDENEYADKFIEATSERPSGQMGDFVDTLYKIAKENMTIEGEVKVNQGILIEEALERCQAKGQFKGKDIVWLKNEFLEKKSGLDYYNELLLSERKILVTLKEVQTAEMLVKKLQEHPYTKDIIGKRSCYNQFIVPDLKGEVFGIPMKGMIDKLEVNDKEKWMQPWDLKTTAYIERFFSNFRKLKYDFQNAIYVSLLRHFYPDYEVRPMKFIVADKSGGDPLIVETDESHVKHALNGYNLYGGKYRGVYDVIEDIEYCKKTGIWTSTAEIQRNNGKVMMRPFTFEMEANLDSK